MFAGYVNWLVYQAHYSDLLQEAERERLARSARPERAGRGRLLQTIAARAAQWLAHWNELLHPAQPSLAACC